MSQGMRIESFMLSIGSQSSVLQPGFHDFSLPIPKRSRSWLPITFYLSSQILKYTENTIVLKSN